MKKILVLFFAACLAAPALKAQTESETIDWLNAKVPPLCNPVYGIHTKFKSHTWEMLHSFFSGTDKKSKGIEIDPYYISNISSKKFSNGNGTTIFFTSRNNDFTAVQYSYNGARETTEKVNNVSLDLNTTNETEINKIMKALKHLATLKGATLVKDDLF